MIAVLTGKNIRMAVIALSCAFIMYYSLFLTPLIRETARIKRDIDMISISLSDARQTAEEIDNLTAETDRIRKDIDDKKSKLPASLDSYDIVMMLNSIDNANIVRNSIIFMSPYEKEEFTIVPVRFSCQTDFEGFLTLLESLDELTVTPAISNMQLSAARIGGDGKSLIPMEEIPQMGYNLRVDMTLNFFTGSNKETGSLTDES